MPCDNKERTPTQAVKVAVPSILEQRIHPLGTNLDITFVILDVVTRLND